MSVVVLAMVTVSCNDTSDPFLKTSVQNDYKTNKKNFETLTDILQNNCCLQSDYYQKISDKWEFINAKDLLGMGVTMCFMSDSGTLVKFIESGDYGPVNDVWITEYSISYNPTTATITTTEILSDGTAGETYCSTLLAAKPIVVIEGPFAGMIHKVFTYDYHLVECPARWCFEVFDRAYAVEHYEKWLNEHK